MDGTDAMGEQLRLDAWGAMFHQSATEVGQALATFLPRLALAVAILAAGWLFSRAVAAVAARALHRVGLDGAADRLRVSETLREGGLHDMPSSLVARLLFWILMLSFLLSAVQALGLAATTATVERLVGFLPSLVAAALVLIVGLLLARLVRNLVASGAAASSLAYAQRLGALSQAVVVVVVVVLAIEQLGIDTAFLIAVGTALVGTLGLTLGIAFSLGAKDLVTHILAGHYLRQSLPPGRIAEVQGRSGVVEQVGAVATVFRDEERSWSVPNARLLQEIVSH